MYFVDREKLIQRTRYIEMLVEQFKSTERERFKTERIAHMLVESSIDIGNMMIDGFIMRDPGSYQDVLDIMKTEQVIDEPIHQHLSEMLVVRRWLLREYESEHDELNALLEEHIDAYTSFTAAVIQYLEQELGPVNAFGEGES